MKKPLFIFITIFFALSSYAQMGIGTTSPNSTLDVRGSFSVNYRSFTSGTTASATDHTLAFTGSSAATLSLPDAIACTGRTYSVKNISTTLPAPVLTIATASSQTIDGNTSWLLDEQNEMVTLISNGANWNIVSKSPAKTRNNYVLVKTATDFPAAVSGIITLAVNTVYEINGSVTLTNKINLNGSKILGVDRDNDVLLYTGSAELFTGSYGGHIQCVTLSATTSGAKLFNLNNTDGTDHLVISECLIKNSDNVGLIKGFLRVNMFEIEYDNNNNGITYESITHMTLTNIKCNDTNHGIYEKFAGTFEVIQKLGGISDVRAANSAIAIDVTGVVSITTRASLNNIVFDGDGTYVNGTFSKYWYVSSFGIPTESDEVATGNLYVSTKASTTFTTVNTPVKIAGTTTATNLFRVTSAANNRLTYTGTKTRTFTATCSLTATQAFSNMKYTFSIAKNGTILPESKQTFILVNSTDHTSLTVLCNVSLAVNDYIEVWVENNTNTAAITVETLNLTIK